MIVRILIIIAFAVLAGAGCSDDKNPVREYGSTLTGAVKKAERAKAVADLVTIRVAIMSYKAERGEYPPNLRALNMREIYPDMYSYDPETGAVDLKQ
jgi:hypothetical protein